MGFKVGDLLCGQVISSRLSLFNGFLDLQQQLFHVKGPVLLVTLLDELQLSEMVSIAERMQRIFILVIGAIPIVHSSTLALRQNTNLIQCLAAALLMSLIVGQ